MKKVIIFICVTALVVLSIFLFPKLYIPNRDFSVFNSELWDEYPRIRYQMISDFEQKYPIDALTRLDVDDLLGEEGRSVIGNMYSYYIGSEKIFSEYYALIFDDSGKCVDRRVYVD